MKPTIGKRAFVPTRHLSPKQVKVAKRSLRYVETTTQVTAALRASGAHLITNDFDHDPTLERFDIKNGQVTVKINEAIRVRGGYSFPRAWAVANLPLEWECVTVSPRHGIAYNGGPTPRDAAQTEFFNSLLSAARAPTKGKPFSDILANADTGTGKSVAGIWLGQQLNTRTLIIVDSNKIAAGWLKNFRNFYGAEWTEKHVGRAQQDKCEYVGKAYTIALVQSLRTRKYPAAFYKAFGLIVVDEVQVFGSEGFAPALYMFPAKVRVGFTAENRSGPFGKRIKHHLGDTRVISKQAALQAKAYLIQNEINQLFYCGSDPAIITGLSRIQSRNENLAKLIKTKGYDRGRNTLILSDRTAHLVQLRKMVNNLGVPMEAMGLHMGSYETDRFLVQYSYGKTKQTLTIADNIGQAKNMVAELRKARYNTFSLPQALYNRLQRGDKVTWGATREIYTPTQAELEDITNSCQLVFATPQIFAKGVDVPRLDMGVEALPLGNVKQPLGRILRLYPDKYQPEWYAVCDRIAEELLLQSEDAQLIHAFLQTKTKSRIEALKKANVQMSRA